MKQTITKDNGTTHTLICSDFLRTSNIKADAIITDTPFGTTNAKWDSVLDLPDMWLWLEDMKVSERTPVLLFAQTPYDKVLGCSNIKKLKYEWIWEKGNATGHLNAKKMPLKCHENILVFYDKPPIYNQQKTSGHTLKESKGNKGGSELYGEVKNSKSYSSTERCPRDVLKFSSDKQKLNLNATQKPIELLRYFIRTYTDKGDTVLDFTAGSMSLAVACYLEGRNSICIEMDEDQYTKSVEWVKHCKEDDIYCIEV